MKIIQFWLWCKNIDIVDKMTWKWKQDFHEIQQGWKGNEDENVEIESIIYIYIMFYKKILLIDDTFFHTH